jgi:hypothetical protein
MVDPLTLALGKIELSKRTTGGILTIAGADPGRIYYEVREQMEKQEILSWTNTTDIEEIVLPARPCRGFAEPVRRGD